MKCNHIYITFINKYHLHHFIDSMITPKIVNHKKQCLVAKTYYFLGFDGVEQGLWATL